MRFRTARYLIRYRWFRRYLFRHNPAYRAWVMALMESGERMMWANRYGVLECSRTTVN